MNSSLDIPQDRRRHSTVFLCLVMALMALLFLAQVNRMALAQPDGAQAAGATQGDG